MATCATLSGPLRRDLPPVNSAGPGSCERMRRANNGPFWGDLPDERDKRVLQLRQLGNRSIYFRLF